MAPRIQIVTGGGAAAGDYGGNCPVQGGGYCSRIFRFERLAWYFRARHAAWTLNVGDDSGDDFGGVYVDEDAP